MRKAIFIVLMFGCGPVLAEGTADGWRFGVTPYLWLPTISGGLKYQLPPGGGVDGGTADVDVGPTDWLELLNFAALASASASKGRYLLAADLVYLSMGSESDGRVVSVGGTLTGPGGIIEIPVDASLSLRNESELKGLTLTTVFGYAVQQTDSADLYLFAGARYFGLDVESTWNLSAAVTAPGGTVLLPASGSIGQDTDLLDVVAGVRGRFVLGGTSWSVSYQLDAGTGDSDLTWNGVLSLAREFGAGDLLLGYRHLEYDQDAGSLVQDFSFSGPGIGFRFRF